MKTKNKPFKENPEHNDIADFIKSKKITNYILFYSFDLAPRNESKIRVDYCTNLYFKKMIIKHMKKIKLRGLKI